MLVDVRLTPNAKQNAVSGFDGRGALKIRVTAKPVEGEANRALISLLSKTLRLPKSAIEIKKGLSSKDKLVQIQGIEKLPEEFYGKPV